MAETQEVEPFAPDKANKPIDVPQPSWSLDATHRSSAVVWLITLLIVLQLALAAFVVIHARKFLELNERIERLENHPR